MSNKAKLDAAIAAAEAKYGDLPPGVLAKIAKVESDYGENLVNPKSSARGPFQFMKTTGPEFGLKDENDRLDFDKSADAAARLTVRNKKTLEEKLGRPVTAGELYLAHQQGADGALKLLSNPDKLAADIRGAEAVKLNGGDPTKTTAGEFANKWISKVDGSGGPAPQKKANAAPGGGGIGDLSAKDYYRYDPRSLARLNANGEKLKTLTNTPRSESAPRPVEAPIARMSIGQLAGATPTVTAPGEEPAPEMSRKDTAILLGLGTYQRMQEAFPDATSVLEGVQAPITAPEGIAGVFSRSVDSGMANAAADREYFGAIIDTLMGNEQGAATRIAAARDRETEAGQYLAGMQSFEQFLNAPTFDGFMTQAISASGQIAPSALESIASALVGGGLFSLAKAGMSTGSKTVAKVLVKDMLGKKAKGAALDKTEESILDGLYKNFKAGAIGGAFGSEYVMASGGAFAEFGEAGVEMDAQRALESLVMGVPQAAIGVWGEKAIVDNLAALALKKSTRKAGDNVLKRFAADVAGLGLKAGLTEGGTELAQESLSVAQRFAMDPTYTGEEAKLRLAQATFAGFFGGGGFGGAAAAPAAGIAAINRSTVGDKVLKKAKDMLGKVRESRTKTEIDEVTKNVNDASLSGATAPESPKDIMAQIDAVIKGDSPKKAVWASEEQSSTFDDIIPGEIKIIKLSDRDDSVVYVANIPGQGNLITPDKNIAEEFMATYHVEGDMDEARRIALGYTSGKTGDNVVRVKDDEDAVVSEQMTDDGGIVDAATAAEEIASTVPGAQVDVTDTNTALEERAQKAALEKDEANELAQFMNSIVESTSDEEIDAKQQAKEAELAAKKAQEAADPKPRRSMFSSAIDYSVSTEDDGAFDVRFNRLHDGGAVIIHDKGTIEYPAEFASDKSDKELLAYSFEPLGFQSATKAAKPAPVVKTKKMEMKSEPISDEEQASQDELDAIDAQIQEAFAAGDMETATVVDTVKPDPAQREGFDQAFAMFVNSVPAGLRDVIDNYRQFKDKLDTATIERTEELSSQNPETVFMFRETEDGAIEIVRNDTATDRDTYLEREAVAAAIKMVYGMAKVADRTGIWFKNAAGKVYRGSFKRRNPRTKAMDTVQGSFSNFYLNNTNKGAVRKLLNLGGTSKTKKNPMGRSGLMALAEAGKRLNAQADRAFQGDGMTQLQQLRSGLETMINALTRAGYQLMYTQRPDSSPVAIDDVSGANGFKYLQGEAANEVFAFIDDKPITVVDLFNVPLPFEASSNGQATQGKPNEFNVETGPSGKQRMKGPDTLGPDPNDRREEVSRETEMQTRTETVRGREATADGRKAASAPGNVITQERAPQSVAVDPSEQFAVQEDKKKRKGGVKEELADFKEEESLRRAQIAIAVAEAKATAKEEGASIPVAVAEVLPAMPDDVTITYTQVGSGWMATVTSPRFERKTVTAKSKNMVIVRAHELAVKESENTAIRYNRLTIETTESTMAEREKFPEISGAGSPEIKDQTSEKKNRKMSPAANSVRFFGNVGKLTGRVASIASAHFRFGAPVDVITLKYLADNFDALTGPGKPYERARDHIADAIEQMNERGKDEPGRVILGPNRHVIILRDEPLNRVSMSDKDDIFYQDDAEIGAVLAHEIGHIVFQQEYDKQINLGPEQSAVWKLYQQQLVEIAAEGTNKDPNPDADDLNWEAFKRAMKIMKEENGEVSPELPRNFKDFKEWRKKYQSVRKTNATLRRAYELAKVQIKEETGVVPESYTNDKNGFEEWYADQVMAFVQNEARQAKNVAEGTIKKLAAAFQQFFNKVNDALNGRLKLFTVKKYNPGTGKNEVVWSFADYMNEVTARHKNNAVLNNEFGVVQQMTVKSMTLNLRSRIPAGAVTAMQNQARRIMSTGKWGKVARGALNLVHASTDFMALPAHGEAGKNLSTFFGTLSQSLDKAGWNKREIFQQNRMHNKLADILGINEKDSPKAWDSPANRAIMLEAFDEDIPTSQLVSQEAKDIRAFYEDIADTYMERPGGQGKLKYWISGFQKRANYGGPRMWNVAKIAEDEQGFITWLEPRLRQSSGTSDAAQRAKDIFDALTQHTQDQVALIARQVDHDVRLLTTVTPANIAMRKFEKSMTERAVMEQRDKTLRELRRGVTPVDDFINELVAFNASDPDAQALRALPADQKIPGIKKYWMKRTQKVRLTPGMDPALRRELAPEIKTIDAYNADPNDPNGWLLPPAKAHAQYMHYIARRVEFEKLGVERGAASGVEYVMEQLDAIPEELQPQIDEAIMANLGKFGENMNSGWRLFNSVAAVWTVFTTLLFTTLSSVTDIAGIATRSKEFNNLGNFVKNMQTTLTTREFQELARAVGVVTGRAQSHMMIGQGELDYANQTSRNIMDAFFRYTGLEFYTRFVRTFAVGMGREFIVNTAAKPEFGDRETRYLAELGITREDVQAWQASNMVFNTPEGEKVRFAIARFADEAVIRPDASQRPTWASNPYLQTVWQLKSYYYGFGKTVMGGIGREIKNRHSEDGNFNGAAGTALLLGVTIFPLAMFGLASREWAKYLFQLAVPGIDEEPFRTSYMTGLEYPWEIFKRSGVMGPFALGLTTMEAFQYEGIAAPFTANIPMFDMVDDFFADGDVLRPIPVLNNIQ